MLVALFLILFKIHIKLRQALCIVVKVYVTSPNKNAFNSCLLEEKFKVFTINCSSLSIKQPQYRERKRNNLGEGRKESFIKYKLFLLKSISFSFLKNTLLA